MNEAVDFWIRRLRLTDIPALLEIERSCFPDPWPIEWFRVPISTRDYCWGACQGNRIVGYIIGYREEESLHIANLAVDLDFRRVGIASILVKRLIDTAIEECYNDVFLEVRRSNEEAIRLYQRFGFKITGVEANYYLGHEDALIMRLNTNGMVQPG